MRKRHGCHAIPLYVERCWELVGLQQQGSRWGRAVNAARDRRFPVARSSSCPSPSRIHTRKSECQDEGRIVNSSGLVGSRNIVKHRLRSPFVYQRSAHPARRKLMPSIRWLLQRATYRYLTVVARSARADQDRAIIRRPVSAPVAALPACCRANPNEATRYRWREHARRFRQRTPMAAPTRRCSPFNKDMYSSTRVRPSPVPDPLHCDEFRPRAAC